MPGSFLHLRAAGVSLVIEVWERLDALPVIRHFGKDLGADADWPAIAAAAPPVRWAARLDDPHRVTVLPLQGDGTFALPALTLADGSRPALMLREVEREANAITLKLEGPEANVDIAFTLDAETGVLSIHTRADADTPLASLAAATLPLPARFAEADIFGGDWANEFRETRADLAHGELNLVARRGRGGHDGFPGALIGTRNFGDDTGEIVAATFGWSGDFDLRLARMREGHLLLQANVPLDAPAKTVETPPLYLSWSDEGANGAAARLHDFLHTRLLPKPALTKQRPVHFNTWEAVYFAHDPSALQDVATRAAKLGVERFVLDDGWFKNRDGDTKALGDWTPDPRKYPHGLTPLIDHVRAQGMEFGLWVEPEMINPDSDLARAHPEWIMREKDRPPLLQRHQLVLDLTQTAVADHLFATLSGLLSANAIGYLKWDMNRDLTEAAPDGRFVNRTYVHALYALIDRLRAAHPDVEIETCASGGGRCDYGILARTDRVWVSDSNDALDRLAINRGAARFLPLRVMGTHVGPAKCHITGRRLGLDLRAHVALFGAFGLEFDVRDLTAREEERLAAHIANYKRHRALIHDGRYRRIETHERDHAADAVVARDGGEALLRVVRTGSAQLGRDVTIRLPGLDPAARYRMSALRPLNASVELSLAPALAAGELTLNGAALEAIGLPLWLPRPETSLVLHLERI